MFLGLELLLSATSALAFTVTGVYFVREAHFTPLQLVLNGTVMEVAYFLLGVPTGIFADAVSRRLCVAVGLVLQGAGLLVLGATLSFGVILGGYAVWGAGAAFFYGAYEAWLTDELGVENVGGAFLRGARLGMVGSPTLLADGADPFTRPGLLPAVSCRLYRDGHGRQVPAPSVAQLRAVLGL